MAPRPVADTAFLAASLCGLCACSAPQEHRETPPVAAPAIAPTIATPAPSVSIPPPEPVATPSAMPTASAASVPREYPRAWIDDAQRENRENSCYELVYKRGCSETRTGKVTFNVTIGDDGSVTRVVEVDNRIRHDADVVSRCLVKKLPRWKFHPPEDAIPTFPVTFVFADKC